MITHKHISVFALSAALLLTTGCYRSKNRLLASSGEGITLVAGKFSGSGYLNGPSMIARFDSPQDIVR